jgi:hypothetical protein
MSVACGFPTDHLSEVEAGERKLLGPEWRSVVTFLRSRERGCPIYRCAFCQWLLWQAEGLASSASGAKGA